MFWKYAGRILPWLEACGLATFKLLDVPSPGWWAPLIVVAGTLLQLAIGMWAPKT